VQDEIRSESGGVRDVCGRLELPLDILVLPTVAARHCYDTAGTAAIQKSALAFGKGFLISSIARFARGADEGVRPYTISIYAPWLVRALQL
jgi:hypothetical protein